MYDYLSDPAQLPHWAHVFCHSIRRDGEDWLADTVAGPMVVRYAADPATGTIDLYSAPAGHPADVAHGRVVANGAGSEFDFTFFKPEDLPEADFDSQRWGLREELRTLRALARQMVR
jgi:hypothetical protein